MSTAEESPYRANGLESLEYAFKYFDLHAKQRMTVFNFFLVLSGALAGGIGATLQGDNVFPLSGLLLSALLTILSVVFYKLDLRTSFLIKHAERALKASEVRVLPEEVHLVGSEDAHFKQWQERRRLTLRAWTYSQSFRLVFFATAFIGLCGLVYSFKLLDWVWW